MATNQFKLFNIGSRNTVMPLTNSKARSTAATNKQMALGNNITTVKKFTPWSNSNSPWNLSTRETNNFERTLMTNRSTPGTSMTRSFGWKPNLPRNYRNRSAGGCGSCGGAR